MTKRKALHLLSAASVLFGMGAIALQEPLTRRVPQFENEHVKVWKSVIVPNQPLKMHRHDHPRAVIALKGGTLKVVKESGESRLERWETGNAYWLTADPPNELHGDVNEGDEPIEVIVIEIKGASHRAENPREIQGARQ